MKSLWSRGYTVWSITEMAADLARLTASLASVEAILKQVE